MFPSSPRSGEAASTAFNNLALPANLVEIAKWPMVQNSSPLSVSTNNRCSTLAGHHNVKHTLAGSKLASECGLLFHNQLQDKEYVYLNAAEFGEVEVVQELLTDPQLDVNCVDYMGRNALLLAVKNEHLDLVDKLVSRLAFPEVEDALLHAISQEKNHLVKMIVDNPHYIRLEKQYHFRVKLSSPTSPANLCRRSQFSADISPLMLAAHTNNHEIIQLLLDRGVNLTMPHDRVCLCQECETHRAEDILPTNDNNIPIALFSVSPVMPPPPQDSLILELQRLHTYQALSSPAYLALSSSDPVSTAFVLRDELYQLASQVKQFKEEYSALAVKCMEFAVGCIDLCRTSDEVHCLLRGNFAPSSSSIEGDNEEVEQRHPLEMVKTAIYCREKKFVAHSNCQHQMEYLFYNLMFCIRDFEGLQRLQFILIFIPLLPFLYLLYLFFPRFQMPLPQGMLYRKRENRTYEVRDILRCPVVKFIGYMVSYLTFLILITVATFRLDRTSIIDVDDDGQSREERSIVIFNYDFRSGTMVMTKIQIILLFWILGQLGAECKQVYHYGLSYFFRSYDNVMDWCAIALYLAAYALRILVDFKVQQASEVHRADLEWARCLLRVNDTSGGGGGDVSNMTLNCPMACQHQHDNCSITDYSVFRNSFLTSSSSTYWLRGCRLWWAADDPEYVSDCLFALGNVLSFARISNLMPAWELLGPLQISLARMVSDIIRFMALFSVMVIAFVVGLTNLYWYFADIIVAVDYEFGNVSYASVIPAFQSTSATFYTLYWALFGQSSNNVTTIDEQQARQYPGHIELAVKESPLIINSLGSILYAVYNACMTIILLNMLIAMMSKSFDEIQGDRLEEWKFARVSLWMVYIDQEDVLPPPLNLLPSAESLTTLWRKLRLVIASAPPKINRMGSSRRRGRGLCTPSSTWTNPLAVIEGQDDVIVGHDGGLPLTNMRIPKTQTTTTVSTFLEVGDSSLTGNPHSRDDDFDSDEEDEDKHGRSGLKRSAITSCSSDKIRANILRRFLFKLQKEKEESSKTAERSLLNYQRQQLQERAAAAEKAAAAAVKTEQSGSDHRTKASIGGEVEEGGRSAAESGGVDRATSQQDAQRTAASDEVRLRGMSSLLMPPSVRRKLEAVATATRGSDESHSRAATEAVARYYLLESTRSASKPPPPESTNKVLIDGDGDNEQGFILKRPLVETFTARTERPIRGAHLRELYKVEQEMHEMSEALSFSRSASSATLSEMSELEV